MGKFFYILRMTKEIVFLRHGRILRSDLTLSKKFKSDAAIKAALWWRITALAFKRKFEYTTESRLRSNHAFVIFVYESFLALRSSYRSLFNYLLYEY